MINVHVARSLKWLHNVLCFMISTPSITNYNIVWVGPFPNSLETFQIIVSLLETFHIKKLHFGACLFEDCVLFMSSSNVKCILRLVKSGFGQSNSPNIFFCLLMMA